jgi:sec-independent protein translocase protein TatC
MDLMEHLDELRGRLLRVFAYVSVSLIVAWNWLYTPLFSALMAPLRRTFHDKHIDGQLIYPHFADPFFLQLKVCAIIAIAMASPLILYEVWGFIAPGLHPHERKPFKIVFPLAVSLFVMGAGLSYVIMPAAFAWFLSYMPPGIVLQQRISDYVLFVVKMCGAFGLGFELPVVLMFAGKIGLLRTTTMKTYWRQAVVLIMIVAAILTPSNDPFTMMMMATPMALLYLASIWLVKWVEPPLETAPYGSGDEVEATPPRRIDPNEED